MGGFDKKKGVFASVQTQLFENRCTVVWKCGQAYTLADQHLSKSIAVILIEANDVAEWGRKIIEVYIAGMPL